MTASRSSHSTSSKGWTPAVREAAFDAQSRVRVRASFAAVLLIKSSPRSGFSGWTPHPRARRGRNRPRPGPVPRLRIDRDRRQRPGELQVGAAVELVGARARQSSPIRSEDSSPPPSAAASSPGRRSPRCRDAITGRLWAAPRSAARSLARSKRWRSPSRLIT